MSPSVIFAAMTPDPPILRAGAQTRLEGRGQHAGAERGFDFRARQNRTSSISPGSGGTGLHAGA
jgi:hypothetical protein